MSHGGPLAIINLLARARIDAIVIGGHAVIYHGYLRKTEDIDLIFRRTPETEPLLYGVP
jgi:hypothetical protein